MLPSMDELLKKMRGRLGESLGSIGETSAPLAEVTTKNLDALKAYSLGIQAVAATLIFLLGMKTKERHSGAPPEPIPI